MVRPQSPTGGGGVGPGGPHETLNAKPGAVKMKSEVNTTIKHPVGLPAVMVPEMVPGPLVPVYVPIRFAGSGAPEAWL